jgi:radical SAM superfamily enzyme YgiQ (UPF0313 family)
MQDLGWVDVLDPNLGDTPSGRYDIIGYSILDSTLANDLWNIRTLKERYPSALHIAGGQGAEHNSGILLHHVDAVVRGYGEDKLEQMIAGTRLEDIDGLFLPEGPTGLVEPPGEEEFFRWSMLDMSRIPYERYWDYNRKVYSERKTKEMNATVNMVRLMTSNYCPMGCTFCSSTNFLNCSSTKKHKVHQLPVDAVVSQMLDALDLHPDVEGFYFNDDNLMFSNGRVYELCGSIIDKGIEKRLMCMGRVDNVEPGVLSAMKDAGFHTLMFGIETFSDKVAKDINKVRSGDYTQLARRAVEMTIGAGIMPQMSLMLFLPTSTEEDLIVTIDNAVDLMGKGARVTVFPFVEAYSGARILEQHRLAYKDGFPDYVIPENVHGLALEALARKKEEDASQPLDALNLFRAVYEVMGLDTGEIDSVSQKIRA